jgi:hypothetical protein
MSTSIVDIVDAAASRWGWSASHRDVVQLEYERFLLLAEQHEGVALVPAQDVDLVWHEHLRHTVDGHSLDGRAPVHDTHSTLDHEQRYAHTLELYTRRFGVPGSIWDLAADCDVGEAPPPPT